MKPKCPCKDCERRKLLCHSTCYPYRVWKGKLEMAAYEKDKEKEKYTDPYRPRRIKNMIERIK